MILKHPHKKKSNNALKSHLTFITFSSEMMQTLHSLSLPVALAEARILISSKMEGKVGVHKEVRAKEPPSTPGPRITTCLETGHPAPLHKGTVPVWQAVGNKSTPDKVLNTA